MPSKTQNRLLALALLSATAGLHAQQPAQNTDGNTSVQLPNENNPQGRRTDRQPYMRPQPGIFPSLAPTTPSPAPPAASPEPAPTEPQQPAQTYAPPPATPAHRASVSYNGGQLAIVASNSSLNQILRDVSRTANIKITGGVAEERVFGNYGPGTPLEVLSALLDGTSGNMFLLQGSDGQASELVLSTRTGGPTPPNPNAAGFDSGNDDAGTPPPLPGEQSEPSASSPAPAQAPHPANADGGPPPPAANSTSSGQSPDGPKTPQQIYDELMKLRQQNQPH